MNPTSIWLTVLLAFLWSMFCKNTGDGLGFIVWSILTLCGITVLVLV